MLWGLVLALGQSGPLCAEQLELVDRYRFVSDDWRFGGFSGIEVDLQGARAFILSDRGNLFRLDMARDPQANITGLEPSHYAWTGGDSEGLAITPDNTWFIATERISQVNWAWYRCFPPHPDFEYLESNKGLETLALAPDGALISLPEQTVRGAFPIYRFAQGAWDIMGQLPPSDGFVPVGADYGPGGRLWILERAFSLWGFRTRIRVWTTQGQDTLLLTNYADYDNLEGISVWQDKQGQTRITLVSDDNFVPFLRGEIVELILRP